MREGAWRDVEWLEERGAEALTQRQTVWDVCSWEQKYEIVLVYKKVRGCRVERETPDPNP